MSHSAYPYDDLALAVFVGGGAALTAGALGLAVAMVRWRGAPASGRVRVTLAVTCSAIALLLAVVLLIVNVHWYAGSVSRCFLDEDALDAILLLAPPAALVAVGAAALWARLPPALARFRGPGLGLSALLALVLLVRWVGVVRLQTTESANAVLLSNCVDGP